MNLKKFISGISALSVAASAFAAVTITASAATSYTEDFSAVTDAAAWWDTKHSDLTASITEAGEMQLVNGSGSGNRAASKAITFEGAAGATIDMDVYGNRGDRSTTLTFKDGSNNTLFAIARTANNEAAGWCRLEVTDAAGVVTVLNGTGVEKFHLNAAVDYENGTVTVKTTNVYNNKNQKQDDSEVTVNTAAAAGTVNVNLEVRRGGTATLDNVVVAGVDSVITTPAYSAPATATDVKTCVSSYEAASASGATYSPQTDENQATNVTNVDFMLDTDASVIEVYPYSTKSGSATVNTPIRAAVGKVSAMNKTTENYNASIASGKWYRMTITIENYAGTMNVDIADIATGSSVFNQDISVRNNSSMRYRQLKITAVEGDSYVANVVIYKPAPPTAVATLEEDNITDDTQYTGPGAGATYSVFKATVTAGTYAIESLYFTLNSGEMSTDEYNETTITAGSPVIFGLIVPMASADVTDITAVIDGDSYVAFE